MSESTTPDYTPAGPEKARHDPTSKQCVDTYESATPHDNSIPAISTVIEGSSVTTGARCGAINKMTEAAASGETATEKTQRQALREQQAAERNARAERRTALAAGFQQTRADLFDWHFTAL